MQAISQFFNNKRTKKKVPKTYSGNPNISYSGSDDDEPPKKTTTKPTKLTKGGRAVLPKKIAANPNESSSYSSDKIPSKINIRYSYSKSDEDPKQDVSKIKMGYSYSESDEPPKQNDVSKIKMDYSYSKSDEDPKQNVSKIKMGYSYSDSDESPKKTATKPKVGYSGSEKSDKPPKKNASEIKMGYSESESDELPKKISKIKMGYSGSEQSYELPNKNASKIKMGYSGSESDEPPKKTAIKPNTKYSGSEQSDEPPKKIPAKPTKGYSGSEQSGEPPKKTTAKTNKAYSGSQQSDRKPKKTTTKPKKGYSKSEKSNDQPPKEVPATIPTKAQYSESGSNQPPPTSDKLKISEDDIPWKMEEDFIVFKFNEELHAFEKSEFLSVLPSGLYVERDGTKFSKQTKLSFAFRNGSKLKCVPITSSLGNEATVKRNRNRFGDGLDELTSEKINFYASDFKPSETIEVSIKNHVGNVAYTNALADNVVSQILTKDQIALIHVYTVESPFYPALNASMRSGKVENWQVYQDYIYHLSTSLKLLSPFEGHLYRGIDCQLDEYKVGKVIVWRAFSSSTKSINVAIDFMKGKKGTLFMINSKSSREIAEFSAIKGEDEVLFLPNTTFKIVHVLEGASKNALLNYIPNGAVQLKIEIDSADDKHNDGVVDVHEEPTRLNNPKSVHSMLSDQSQWAPPHSGFT